MATITIYPSTASGSGVYENANGVMVNDDNYSSYIQIYSQNSGYFDSSISAQNFSYASIPVNSIIDSVTVKTKYKYAGAPFAEKNPYYTFLGLMFNNQPLGSTSFTYNTDNGLAYVTIAINGSKSRADIGDMLVLARAVTTAGSEDYATIYMDCIFIEVSYHTDLSENALFFGMNF